MDSGVEIQLMPNDRLEPWGDVSDTHCEANDLPDPAWLVFWRRDGTVPFVFVPTIMMVPGFRFEALTLHVLHFLDLGVTARLIGQVVFRLLSEGSTFNNRRTWAGFQRGLRALNVQLRLYYRRVCRSLRSPTKCSA